MQQTNSDFRLPAEWEPQTAVLLTWPKPSGPWKKWLAQVELVYANICTSVARFEHLIILCADEQHREHINDLLTKHGCPLTHVKTIIIASDDTWARDHGPITVVDQQGKATILDFTFNGWGGKHPATQDNQINSQLSRWVSWTPHAYQSVDMVLEGGAIESNGQGVLLCTKSCIIAPNRNPQLTQAQIEQSLSHYLGIEQFLWLNHGLLEGDDTDGHIDTLGRFYSTSGIVYVYCDDPTDSHYASFQQMRRELEGFRTPEGQAFECVALPWPAAKFNSQGQRLPATYANFLILNGAVLVPLYEDDADERALDVIAQCFPGREVIGINCLALIEQFGSLHCVTMQIPSALSIME